jgi:hypothetical protein
MSTSQSPRKQRIGCESEARSMRSDRRLRPRCARALALDPSPWPPLRSGFLHLAVNLPSSTIRLLSLAKTHDVSPPLWALPAEAVRSGHPSLYVCCSRIISAALCMTLLQPLVCCCLLPSLSLHP